MTTIRILLMILFTTSALGSFFIALRAIKSGSRSLGGCIFVMALSIVFILHLTSAKDNPQIPTTKKLTNIKVVAVPLHIPINVSVTASAKGKPGSIDFTVKERWGFQEVVLLDEGFDGTLDRVCAVTSRGLIWDTKLPEGYIGGLEPPGGWTLWDERYKQIRAEATSQPDEQ